MTTILFKSFNQGNLVNQANPGSDSIIAGGKTQHHAPKMLKWRRCMMFQLYTLRACYVV